MPNFLRHIILDNGPFESAGSLKKRHVMPLTTYLQNKRFGFKPLSDFKVLG